MATDSQEASRNLQTQAFEAINEVVRSASSDTLLLVAALIPLMLGKLGETLQVQPAVTENRERVSELQVSARLAGSVAASLFWVCG